jgi:hypothetical protein
VVQRKAVEKILRKQGNLAMDVQKLAHFKREFSDGSVAGYFKKKWRGELNIALFDIAMFNSPNSFPTQPRRICQLNTGQA